DASCTSGPAPFSCCTGAGTGFCECKDNAACTGFLTPFPCCRAGTGVGNCGDIFQLSEYVLAQCDNGVLESSQTQTAELPVCVVQAPTDFDCYQTGKVNQHLTGTITLQNVFLTPAVTVSKKNLTPVHRLCAPSVKVTAANPNPGVPGGDHFVGYVISGTEVPKANAKGSVTVPQIPGSVTATVTTAKFLFVPSSKSVAPAPPPAPNNEKTNHFLCYTLDNVKAAKPPDVTVRDQFGDTTIQDFIVKNTRLCAPVDKDGNDPAADTG